MALADRQVEYRGLLLNDPEGPYHLQTVEGLLAAPEVRSSDRPRLARHGLVAGTDWLGGRTITMTLEVIGWDADDYAAAVSDLATALRAGQSPGTLRFRLAGVAGGQAARLEARVRNWALPISHQHASHAGTAVVELVATDPLIYSDELSVDTMGLYVPANGMTFPLTFPLVFPGEGSFGSLAAYNAGNAPSSPIIRINGPVNGPALTNYATGRTISVAINLQADEWLDIDVANRTVLLNGTANRYSYLQSAQWWDIEPGWNELRYTADLTSSSTVTISYRSAWA